ncbi:hypothetical protein [Enterococcus mundtii]|uniref:hypothetical protein n=1 Tax=Enterococcus mundtii TaxID=53346 RepID=UPI0035C67A62
MRKLQQQMPNQRLKGRFNNEQKYKVGLVICQPMPDFAVIFFLLPLLWSFGWAAAS